MSSKKENNMGKNYSLTCNNPKVNLTEFFDRLKHGAKYARAQLEKGEGGTPHFQACVGYVKNVRIARMIKDFPGCNVDFTRNAMASWNYCGKEDTRLEGPLEHGVPPAAKNVKGDTAARNKMIIEYGVIKAVNDGIIPIQSLKQVKQSVDLYHQMSN